jgi:hypothetical protein
MKEQQMQPKQRSKRISFGWCWSFFAIFSMSLLGRTFYLHGTCFQKLPGQLCGFHRLEHGEYEQQLYQYPKILQKFDVLRTWRQHMVDGDSCSSWYEHHAPHLVEWTKLRLLEEQQ